MCVDSLGGDQLTAARTRSSKRIRSNSMRGRDKLEGLEPICEDWHAKMCILGVCAILFLKELSHGSPHTHRKIDNDIHNVLCQQLARRQDHAGLYVVHTYIAQ